jgi:hypothetical protein
MGSPLDAELLLREALADHVDEAARGGAAAVPTPAEATRADDLRFLLGVCYQKSGRADEALTEFDAVRLACGQHARPRCDREHFPNLAGARVERRRALARALPPRAALARAGLPRRGRGVRTPPEPSLYLPCTFHAEAEVCAHRLNQLPNESVN